MARPIAPTPKLDAKASKEFLDRVAKDLKRPMKPLPTPRVEGAIKKVMADARRGKKQD
jgi:hypothetical protein